ncbi:cytochrome P450 3A8-like [Oppia nitens]|uniref:cytochrome P450 3A8-like n=1 Tax=Oppia nitens TaxID=1686743 RepID=UPI0023DACBEE|nr:cytochrome P450 3A8-like [Oppia nitens]
MFTMSIQQMILDNYKKYGKVYGAYMGNKPALGISDPQLVKEMNIKDFHVFTDRQEFLFGDELQDRALSNLRGNEWKNMRSIISPTFSSGKMRAMHPIIIDCVHCLDEYLEPKAVNKETIEMKKTMGCLTMDVIAGCAFGTKIDVYNDRKPSEFVMNAQKVFTIGWRFLVFIILMSLGENVKKLIGFKLTPPSVTNFFTQAIQSIIVQRKSEKNVKHKDYLQLILDAKNKTLDTSDDKDIGSENSEQIYGQSDDKTDSKTINKIDITDTDVLASSFIFFVAGYETTGSLLSLLFYRLALDEKCQQKLYKEIQRFDGQYDDYETIAKMHYLEACIAETLRLYNPVASTQRIASQDYTIESIGLEISKGCVVSFDVETLHHNPEYYPEPDSWDPERFMPYNRDKLVPYTYMPFGLGPRNCVGMRFALMEAKTATAYLVNKYHFFRTPKTQIPLIEMKMQFLRNFKSIDIGIELR